MKKMLLIIALLLPTIGLYSQITDPLQLLQTNMVYVQGGTFNMGATDGYGYDDERPIHQVTLSSFLISKYEVTQELWQAVMGSNPSTFIGEKLPVNNVSWNECQEFIKKLNALTGRSYRLPTEAEWEYAARGGAKSTEAVNNKGYQFAGGYQSTHSMIDYCWYKDNSAGTTHAVGLKNPNELGLYDMSGNVCEFCQDNHTWTYPNTSQINPLVVEDGSEIFVYRGGSYDRPSWQIRIASRYGTQKGERRAENGLRLVLDATGVGFPSKRKFALSYSSQESNIVEELSGIRFVRDGSQDRYAWTNAENNTATYTSLGEAFDIKNVKYISRFNVQLAEAKGEELYKALEQETAYGKSDVDAVMKALESNPNVDYSSSSEEESVVVKVAGDSLYTVYIVNPSEQPFGDSPQSSVVQSYRHTTRATPFYESTGRNGKIAVFNYFTGLSSYDGQNKIIEGLMSMFNQHDYGVEYYPYELFTQENLLKVIDNSAHYKAIIVMSHGTYNGYDSHSYIAVSDEYTRKTPDSWNPFDTPDSPHITDKHKPWLMRIWSGTRYNAMLPTYTLTDNVSSNCILYIGACEALKGGGVLKTKTVVGWKTVNTFSQAHATILFSRMLNYGKSLREALKSLIIPYSEGELLTVISEDKWLVGGESTKPIYEDNLVRIEMDQSTWPYYKRQPFYRCWHYAIQGKVTYLTTNHTPLKYFYLKFVPLVAGDKEYRVKVKVNRDGTFSKMYELSNFMDGAYHVVFGKTKDFERNQLPSDKPYSLIYSDKFKENSADDVSQADGNLICIVDDAGNETYKLSMTKGSKKSLQIFEYEDNSYSISLDREGVVSAQLNGMQIDINAIQEGSTRLVVHQQDKERTSVIHVYVDSGIDESIYKMLTPLDRFAEYDNQDTYHKYCSFSNDNPKVSEGYRTPSRYEYEGIGIGNKYYNTDNLNILSTLDCGYGLKEYLCDYYEQDGSDGYIYYVLYKNDPMETIFRVSHYYLEEIEGMIIYAVNISTLKDKSYESLKALDWGKAKSRFFPASGIPSDPDSQGKLIIYQASSSYWVWINLGYDDSSFSYNSFAIPIRGVKIGKLVKEPSTTPQVIPDRFKFHSCDLPLLRDSNESKSSGGGLLITRMGEEIITQ